MQEKFTRREFFRKAGIIGVATYGLGRLSGGFLDLIGEAEAAPVSTIAVASSGTIAARVKKAIDGVGGIGKFVKKGNSVVIKPNLAWARTPEQAANTNPDVIRALIDLCKQAGAGRITVIDHTCDSSKVSFEMSGANKAVAGTGARIVAGDSQHMYKRLSIPKGKTLKSDMCLREVLEADVVINVPIAKVHGGASITASMKNLMGTNWDRQAWHRSGLDQCIADYSTAVKPNLIVLDAYRVLLTGGPKGPGEVKQLGRIAASVDPVAIDAYAATLLGKQPGDVKHISLAAGMGLGEMDLKKVTVKSV